MVVETSEVDVLTSSLSPAHNNTAVDSSLVGADVSGSLVVDVIPTHVDLLRVPDNNDKVEVTKEEGHFQKSGVPDDRGDLNGEKGEAEEGGDDEEPNEDNLYLNDETYDEVEDGDDVDNDSVYDDEDNEDEEEEEEEAYAYDDEDNEDEEEAYADDFMEEDDEDDMDEENKVDYIDENKQGESAVKENEVKGDVSLEPMVEKLKKKMVIKKIVRRDLGKNLIFQIKDKSEGDEKNVPMDEEKGNKTEEVEEKGEANLKKKAKRSRIREGKKVISGSSAKAASKPKDKLDSKLGKNSGSRRTESMGMIFMCSSKTKPDCYRYHVLGLPAGKRNIVQKIYKGMRLFLYDVDLKLLYGIYKAAGRGGYNIEPKAFDSKFPSQVRFTILEDCIPLAEEKFRKVIKDNYFTKNKFDCQLKQEQVKNLCKLFAAASNGSKSKRLDRSRKAKVRAPITRYRSRALGADERRRSDLDANHRDHDYFHVRQRDIVVSPVARVSQVASLPPPITSPRYGYDRALERDAYRQNILVEHRDPYRQPFSSRDAYRRQPLSDYRDVYRQEPVMDYYDGYRREGVLEHHDTRPINLSAGHQDEIARQDPYGFYRERQSYRDAAYIEHLPAEPDRYHSVSTEHRYRGAPISDYRSTRALYRY